jgi:hypothetical protein
VPKRFLALAALIALGAVRVHAQADSDAQIDAGATGSDGCVYNRVWYPAGTEMCQDGDLVRCEDGAWSDEGDCSQQEAPETPNTQGGDEQEPQQ